MQADAAWTVECLCAEWCGTCRDYRPVFEQAAREHPALAFSWCDIEDDPETAGDVDVETFPTLRVSHQGEVKFLGPLLPHPQHLHSLLKSLTQA